MGGECYQSTLKIEHSHCLASLLYVILNITFSDDGVISSNQFLQQNHRFFILSTPSHSCALREEHGYGLRFFIIYVNMIRKSITRNLKWPRLLDKGMIWIKKNAFLYNI